MLTATIMPRVFCFRSNGQDTRLDDPDSNWTPDAVLNYYIQAHPILATATVQKPIIKDDAITIEFTPTIGTKG